MFGQSGLDVERGTDAAAEGYVRVGDPVGKHLALDSNGLQSKTGALFSNLNLNRYGGDVIIGNSTGIGRLGIAGHLSSNVPRLYVNSHNDFLESVILQNSNPNNGAYLGFYNNGNDYLAQGLSGVSNLLVPKTAFIYYSEGVSFSISKLDSTRLFIDTFGRMGLGTNNPTGRLTINNINTSSFFDPEILFYDNESSNGWSISGDHALNGTGLLLMGQASNTLGVPDFQGGVNYAYNPLGEQFEPFHHDQLKLGSSSYMWIEVWATNGTIQTSDARMKKNIQPVQYGLQDIMKLKPVSYEWRKEDGSGAHLGFLAQEIYDVLPEVVVIPKEDNSAEAMKPDAIKSEARMGMKYAEIIPVLVKAIQDQQQIIEDMQKEIDTLKK